MSSRIFWRDRTASNRSPGVSHVEFPSPGAGEAVIGLENVVATEFHRGFEPGIIALNAQNATIMTELMEARDFGMLLEQASDGTLDEGQALEFAPGDPRLQTPGTFEEPLFRCEDHGDFLDPALGAAAEHECAVGVLGVGDFANFHLLGFGVANVAFENFVGEGKAVFIEGHADGDLPAIAALFMPRCCRPDNPDSPAQMKRPGTAVT